MKECRAISLPLFLTEELSCHDFHEESIDFFEANPSDSIGPTASAKGRATPKLQLKPKLSPSTILNMRSPELLSFYRTQESDDDDMAQLETFGDDFVESRNSSPDDVLRLPFQSMSDKVSSRMDTSYGPSESSCLFSIPKNKSTFSQLQRPVAHRHIPDRMNQRHAPINGAPFSYVSETIDCKSCQCSHWIFKYGPLKMKDSNAHKKCPNASKLLNGVFKTPAKLFIVSSIALFRFISRRTKTGNSFISSQVNQIFRWK